MRLTVVRLTVMRLTVFAIIHVQCMSYRLSGSRLSDVRLNRNNCYSHRWLPIFGLEVVHWVWGLYETLLYRIM